MSWYKNKNTIFLATPGGHVRNKNLLRLSKKSFCFLQLSFYSIWGIFLTWLITSNFKFWKVKKSRKVTQAKTEKNMIHAYNSETATWKGDIWIFMSLQSKAAGKDEGKEPSSHQCPKRKDSCLIWNLFTSWQKCPFSSPKRDSLIKCPFLRMRKRIDDS